MVRLFTLVWLIPNTYTMSVERSSRFRVRFFIVYFRLSFICLFQFFFVFTRVTLVVFLSLSISLSTVYTVHSREPITSFVNRIVWIVYKIHKAPSRIYGHRTRPSGKQCSGKTDKPEKRMINPLCYWKIVIKFQI